MDSSLRKLWEFGEQHLVKRSRVHQMKGFGASLRDVGGER